MVPFITRWRWALAIGTLLLAALLFAFWPAATPVDTGKVTRGAMEVGITDDGVTRAEEFYVISAPVTGYLSRIELEAGDTVGRGVLITHMTGRPATPLDTRSRQEAKAALAAARAAQRSAGASLSQARRDLVRAEKLAKRGFLSKAQLESDRTRVTTGQAAVSQARAEAARASALLASASGKPSGAPIPVRAPASGTVLSVITESEGVIIEGTPLMTIGDAGKIEVVVDLLSRDAVRVEPGHRVMITQWGGPNPLPARVERIEPYGTLKISALGIEEQRVNVIIRFTDAAMKQAARLGHGYQIDATIVLWEKTDALRVAIGALFRGTKGEWRVFVNDGGRASSREVSLGHINDEYGEVTGGLAEGDEVVLNPAKALEDGGRISPR